MKERTQEEALRKTTGGTLCRDCASFDMGWCKTYAKSVNAIGKACVYGAEATAGQHREKIVRVVGEMRRFVHEISSVGGNISKSDFAKTVRGWCDRIDGAMAREQARANGGDARKARRLV